MKNYLHITDKNIFQTYRRYPVLIVKGRGSRLWDNRGKQYLDFLSGIAVCNLGHCHPAIVRAVQSQVKKLIHVSNFFYTEPQAELSQLLVKHSFADRVFFCNSGAEANEAALKLARRYAHQHGNNRRFEVITMQKSFHGRTFATLSATGQEKFHNGFKPLLRGFRYVPFNDIDALKKAIRPSTCAVMLEPIQGEGGVNCPSNQYLKQVRALCDKHQLLLIVDEVQVGMGRTGKIFAYEHYGIRPDIMTLAKALGGGIPVGAMLAKKKIAQSLTPGSHASTFGGNPIAMAAGIAVMEALIHGDILKNCQAMGNYFKSGLTNLMHTYPDIIKEVRGKGLMLGMELKIDGKEIATRCLQYGIIINCTLDKILRFLPPLIIKKKEIDQCLETLNKIFSKIATSASQV